MTRRRVPWLLAIVILVVTLGGLAGCTDCPEEVVAGRTQCVWRVVQTDEGPRRGLVCTVGDQTIRVDTAGIGEG